VTGTIFRIARFSVHDGPGIRTTVFLKGCPLRCAWCHSPESQHPAPQLAWHRDRCLQCGACATACDGEAISSQDGAWTTDFRRCRACGACVTGCPSGARELVGREVTSGDLLDAIERDALFYEESGGGATFSGGEPLMQPAFLEALLRGCRERGVRTAVDTCGLVDPDTFARFVPQADLFLFDVKARDEARHREITGGSSASILENLQALARARRPVRIRVPLVPGLTDDERNLSGIGSLLRDLALKDVDVLPYHRAGLAKYERLGLEPPPAGLQPPDEAQVTVAVATLRGYGLRVQVGG
jgi:pyruvate formate lyase activating enzyme